MSCNEKKLSEWPRPPRIPGMAGGSQWEIGRYEEYWHKRADAALERLRLAYEALQAIDRSPNHDNARVWAMSALRRIGELPND